MQGAGMRKHKPKRRHGEPHARLESGLNRVVGARERRGKIKWATRRNGASQPSNRHKVRPHRGKITEKRTLHGVVLNKRLAKLVTRQKAPRTGERFLGIDTILQHRMERHLSGGKTRRPYVWTAEPGYEVQRTRSSRASDIKGRQCSGKTDAGEPSNLFLLRGKNVFRGRSFRVEAATIARPLRTKKHGRQCAQTLNRVEQGASTCDPQTRTLKRRRRKGGHVLIEDSPKRARDPQGKRVVTATLQGSSIPSAGKKKSRNTQGGKGGRTDFPKALRGRKRDAEESFERSTDLVQKTPPTGAKSSERKRTRIQSSRGAGKRKGKEKE